MVVYQEADMFKSVNILLVIIRPNQLQAAEEWRGE